MKSKEEIETIFREVNEIALPLQKWLMKNYNPTCEIRVTESSVTILTTELHSTNSIDWDNIDDA